MADTYSGPGELFFNGVRVDAWDLAVDFADEGAADATGVTGLVRGASATIEVTASATIPASWGEPAPLTLAGLRAAFDALPAVRPDVLVVHPRQAAAIRWYFDRVVARESRGEYVPEDERQPPVTRAALRARRAAYLAADGPALPGGVSR